MPKAKPNYIRILFTATVLAIVTFVSIALLQRQDNNVLVGKWRLAAVDGVKAPPNSSTADDGPDIRADGTFEWHSFQISGNWKVEDAKLILHTEKYDGKSREQFAHEMETKYPSDPTMQKIAAKVFEQLKLGMNADGSSLSIDLGGIAQTYSKSEKK